MLSKPESTFVIFIYLLKLAFIILSLYKIYVKRKTPYDDVKVEQIQFWKERIEFVFIICMSILLIKVFYPFSNQTYISNDKRTLFFLFGLILIVTARWEDFFSESKAFVELQKVIGRN
jgi:hypothetical protein